MLNPILSIERVEARKQIVTLKRIREFLPEQRDKDNVTEQIERLESYLVHTKSKSKNLFKICLGLDTE